LQTKPIQRSYTTQKDTQGIFWDFGIPIVILSEEEEEG